MKLGKEPHVARETRVGHRSAVVFSVSAKWKWTSIWMHFDLLQITASSAFEVFKIWVMMLK